MVLVAPRGCRTVAASLAVCLSLCAGAARADVVDELNAAVMAHDISDLGHGKESNSTDIQFEIDTTRPHALKFLGSPRLNAVVAVNTSGLTSFAAAGLAWDSPLWRRLHGKVDLGLAADNGVLSAPYGSQLRADRLIVGSRVLFREAATVEWRCSKRWGVQAQFEHLSNGGILGSPNNNEGITDAGLALAYHFN